MGNIVTPDQGLLPLPSYSGVITPYPWWLNAALAIWALLALLCCWCLLLLYLLRYCCKWWRHRQYAADRASLRERFFGGGGAKGRNDIYATQEHFATAPLPPVPPYAVSNGNDVTFRDMYEGSMPYVTAGRAMESDSVAYSDGGVVENVETNVHRKITKNYYINEEKNYFIQNEPKVEIEESLHNQEVQRLPGPTVTTINMAAERITDNPNWENTNAKEVFNEQQPKKASAEIVSHDSSVTKQEVKYESPPDIYTHRAETPVVQNRSLAAQESVLSEDGSITSEMSGHDSESIYETIRVFTPKKQSLAPLEDEDEDEDEYKTAGIDEVEFEVKDLVRLQRAHARNGGDSYDDILTSHDISHHDLKPQHSSSISSSSTLNNLVARDSQSEQINIGSGEEKTVTQTVQTQQIQTTFRQIGQHLGESAFFVPLSSAITYNEGGQQHDESKIAVPISTTTTTIEYDEHPALQHF
ncbi:unnamed protein product [Adineta steineri]|uniref:Uncharacterized protein n=1 Tax=Adineta steineri TaxID=433720 RepID=A0A816CHJ6_9BILA|nr:unnamed protein product [Adineta steineri]CAF1621414.1 unnamed protein product [Adineta steineri]